MSVDTSTRYVIEAVSTADHVPLVRHEAATVLYSWGLGEEAVFTACLIVTELVSNVARHAALLSPTSTTTLVLDEMSLVISVADSDPFQPRALEAAHDDGGRGLLLVKLLVEEAGGGHEVLARSDGCGKQITARLPLTAMGS